MAEDDRSRALAERLSEGVAALRAGRPDRAVPALLEVADDPELAQAEDMRDIRARALSLCAQALLLVGRSGEAQPRAEASLALARLLGDLEGVQEVEQLLQSIRSIPKPAPREPMRAPSASVAEIEGRVRDPVARGELLIRKANAQIEAGQPEEGARTARLAIEAAPDAPRIAVLARLSLARARPEEAPGLLADAAECARDAHEPTLLGMVARAAELAGIELESQHGPDLVARGPGG